MNWVAAGQPLWRVAVVIALAGLSAAPDMGCRPRPTAHTGAVGGAPSPNNALHKAVAAGDTGAVEAALLAGADPNATEDGETALAAAATLGEEDVVACLLRAPGIEVDAGKPNGYTPLMAAASSCRTEVVRMLVAAGADVNARGPGGQTVLHNAARHASPELIECLLDKGADLAETDDHGRSALHFACLGGNTAGVEYLAGLGADLSACDDSGRNCVYFAASGGSWPDLVDYLLKNGVTPNCADANGDTPLLRASARCDLDVASLLLGAGADPTTRNAAGVSPAKAAELEAQKLTEQMESYRRAVADGHDDLRDDLDDLERRVELPEILHEAERGWDASKHGPAPPPATRG